MLVVFAISGPPGKLRVFEINMLLNLGRDQIDENAKVSASKLRNELVGKSTAPCKRVEDAFEVERKREIEGFFLKALVDLIDRFEPF